MKWVIGRRYNPLKRPIPHIPVTSVADVFFVNDTKDVHEAVDNVDPHKLPVKDIPPDDDIDNATGTNNA